MSAFQVGKHFLIPGIDIWESHLFTNLFIALLSTLAVYFGIRINDRLKQAAAQEMSERKRLVAKLDQVNNESGFNSIDFAAPEEKERLNKILAKDALAGNYPTELEYWIVRKDGTRRCVHDRYSYGHKDGVIRSFIITSDINERVQAYQMLERAVEERPRELSTVLDYGREF